MGAKRLEQRDYSPVLSLKSPYEVKHMGPVSYVIAILGCADGGASCQQVAVASSRYETAAACEAATGAVLSASTDFDFPTLVARCRAAKSPAAVERMPVRRGLAIKEG
jgi:hypothetical protein